MKLRYVIMVVLFAKITASDSIIRVKTPPALIKEGIRTTSPSRLVNPPTSPRDEVRKLMKRKSQQLLSQVQQSHGN